MSCCYHLSKVREARFIDLELFLAVLVVFMFICMHSVLLLNEMELHVYLGVDLSYFRHCMWVDSGELCYSRPSGLGESIRMLTLVLPRALAQARDRVLSDRPARSSETASPEREIVNLPMTHCCRLA